MESSVVVLDAPLIASREVARGMWVLSLEAPEVAATARAGQFVNLGLEGFLLRRPFSVYRAEGDRIEVILKAVGAGTERLLSMRPGDAVSCLGPLGDDVIMATDDGSSGFAGTAVAAAPDADLVLACGPNRMLAAVADRWPDAQVAVETYMGCGTGVCLGCAVPLVSGGYDRACTEGPVYRAADIDWPALPSHLHYAVSA